MRRLLHTVMSGKDGRNTTFEVSRRKILLATTTLAAASALGSTAHAQTAQAQTATTAQTQAKYTPTSQGSGRLDLCRGPRRRQLGFSGSHHV